MTRKKVKLAFIENSVTRKATYKKRKKGLLKKVSELSTLCGIHACAIIYSPYDLEPEVWPSTLGVQHVIAQFQRLPKIEQMKKMLDQETFLRQRIGNINEQLKKQQIENQEKEITEFMYQSLMNGKIELQNLTLLGLNNLGLKIDQKLKEINNRIETIRNMAAQQQVAQLSPPQPQMPAVTHQMQLTGMHVQEKNLVPEWFGDCINCPIKNIGFGHGREDQTVMPFSGNPTTNWPRAFYP